MASSRSDEQKAYNALLEQSKELQAKLTAAERTRLALSAKGTDQWRADQQRVNEQLEESKKRLEAMAAQAAPTTAALRSIGEGAQASLSAIAGHLTSAITAAGRVDLSQSMQSVRTFENSVDALSVATGRSMQTIQQGFNDTGRSINERPAEVAQWTRSIADLTYNVGTASQGLQGTAEYAHLVGKSVADVLPLTVALQTVGRVGGDTSKSIGVMIAQADALGTVGGPRAIADAFVNLQGVISMTSASAEKTTALIGGIGDKSLSPQRRERVAGQALGALTGDTVGWERFLGHSITDETGAVSDPTKALKEIKEKVVKRYGKDARRILQLNLGGETGAAVFATDFDAIEKAEKLAPSDKAKKAAEAAAKTMGGQIKAGDVLRDVGLQKLTGAESGVAGASKEFGDFTAAHPAAGLVDSMLSGNKMYDTAKQAYLVGRAGDLELAGSDRAAGVSRGGTAGGNQLRGGRAPERSALAVEADQAFKEHRDVRRQGGALAGGAFALAAVASSSGQGQTDKMADALLALIKGFDPKAQADAANRAVSDGLSRLGITVENYTGGTVTARVGAAGSDTTGNT